MCSKLALVIRTTMKVYNIILTVFAIIFQYETVNGSVGSSESRIIGGQIADEGQFLFPVSLQYLGSHMCGGSLIENNTVLTAAHCIINDDPRYYTVAAGIYSLNYIPESNKFKVMKIVKHKKYGINNSYLNDIAVLKLQVRANTTIGKEIKLNENYIKDYSNCTVIGWGDTIEGAKNGSIFLRYVYVPIIPKIECSLYYEELLSTDMLCAGGRGKDSCQGDSGGPLVCNDKLAGIVSFGRGCGKVPGVYTDVSHYISWIKAAQNSSCIKQSSHFFIIALVFSILILKLQ
uniref:Putative trypsin-like serine protease n=1 Tax=Xenopsylla cheopis TaxID=163159 RepID=A0A6M2E398_XENCH